LKTICKHWVELSLQEDRAALLLCQSCRTKKLDQIDTSIPLPLLTRPQLLRLLEMKTIENLLPSARRYRELLEHEFSSQWEDLIQKKKTQQTTLFEPEQFGGLPLTGN